MRDVPCERQPLRVVVDSRLETPPTAKVLTGGNVLVFAAMAGTLPGAEVVALPNADGKVDLAAMLAELGRRGLNEVLTEAGTKLNGSLLKEALVDELLIYQAPLLLGDAARGMFGLPELTALAGATRLEVMDRRVVGADFRIRARPA